MGFPATRLRRLRRSAGLRELVRETDLAPGHLVLPLFVHLERTASPVDGMPGVERLPISEAVARGKRARELGVPAVLLFGIPPTKDDLGSQAWDDEGVVQLAVQALKAEVPELVVLTDVCLCQYTSHGHCGVLAPDGSVDNDATLELLARTAVSHARAGADAVAPSDMMDGRVAAIRAALDEEGFGERAIVSYAAKFASAFYGPFRAAADSAPAFGDRRGYQLDPANLRQALREVELDVAEGADVVMVKPALTYLDVIARVRDAVQVPVAAYNVSGEYAMLKYAAAAGALDERAAVLEALLAMRRAGADLIVTYFADEVAGWLA